MGLIKTDGIAPNGSTGLLLYTDIQATVVGLKLESGGGVGFGSAGVPSGIKVDVLGNIAAASLSMPTSSTITTINTISTMRIGQTNSSIKLNIGCNGSSSWIQSYNTSNSAGAPLLLQSGGGNVGIGGDVGIGGNVGIGTVSPASPLHIRGTPGQLLLLEGVGSTSYMRFISNSLNRGYFGHFDTAQKGMYIINQRAVSELDSSLYLGTADSVKLTITGNGNVGIGTAAPAVSLDIVGEARSSTSTTAASNAKTLVTKDYVDESKYIFTYGNTVYSTSSYTNLVDAWSNTANYFDVYPPAGKIMANLVAFIPSIAVIYFGGGVNADDNLRCTWANQGTYIRVWVQNTEQSGLPAANWLAIWKN